VRLRECQRCSAGRWLASENRQLIGEGALVCGSRFATATYAERFEYFSGIPDPLNQGDWKFVQPYTDAILEHGLALGARKNRFGASRERKRLPQPQRSGER
jgi:hypothetical protein